MKVGQRMAGGLFHGGSAGVDFFFVLSGFIIWHRHARDFGQLDKLPEFGWRRVVRVYPVYWIVSLVAIVMVLVQPGYLGRDVTDLGEVASSLLLLPTDRGPILFVGWTLMHELWFYLIFAGLIAFQGKWIRVLIGLWSLAMIAILFVDPTGWWANPWFRVALLPLNLEFVLGCAAAWIVARAEKFPSAGWRWLAIVGLAGFAAVLLFDPRGDFRIRLLGYGTCSFLAILGLAGDTLHGRALGEGGSGPVHRAAVFLGDASYSVYLVHTLVLSIAWKAGEITGILPQFGPEALAWLCVLAGVAGGCGFHLLVEKPLLRKLNRRDAVRIETAGKSSAEA